MKISTGVLLGTILLGFFVLSSCERLNMYDLVHDITSQNSRTAYAIAYNGKNYSLILANIHYTKITELTSGFTSSPTGLSVNEKGEIIIFNTSGTYIIKYDFHSWEQVASRPLSNTVIGHGDAFIYVYNDTSSSTAYICTLNTNTLNWDCNTLGLVFPVITFKGLDYQMYLIDNQSNFYLYSSTGTVTSLFQRTFSHPLSPIRGIRTNHYFYVWSTNFSVTNNSIFRITPEFYTCLNTTTSMGNSLHSITVTDNDRVFAIVVQGTTRILKEIISDGNYPEILTLGTSGFFTIDSLDDRHIVIASSGNTDGFNGLIIYDVEQKNIVNHVTKNNILALYVRR